MNFLPLPLYIVICLALSTMLFITAIKQNRKQFNSILYTVALMPLLAAVGRIFKQFSSYISVSILILVAILLIELLFITLSQKNQVKSKGLIMVGFGIIIVTIIPVLILLIFFK